MVTRARESGTECIRPHTVGDNYDDGHVDSDAWFDGRTVGRDSFTQAAILYVEEWQLASECTLRPDRLVVIVFAAAKFGCTRMSNQHLNVT
jgi:hypothetical protein